jgi:hypothetical protein
MLNRLDKWSKLEIFYRKDKEAIGRGHGQLQKRTT